MKYMLYKCITCGTQCNFKEGTAFSKQCPKCGKDLSFWTNFESDEELPEQVLANDTTKEKDITIKDIYNDIHTIKNIMVFYFVLTIIDMIITFILLSKVL